MLAQGLEQQGLLQRIARLDRTQDARLDTLVLRRADQRLDVLGKARAAIAAAGIDEVRARCV